MVEEHLAAIDERDADLHAFNLVTRDEALAAADAVDAMVAGGGDPGPLAGVPVALKDNLCTTGVATTCSSRILEGWKPPYDATVVERLAAAGAIVIGKTNLDEFAMGSSTENSAFGPTRNPHDPSRVPGGSSGGSAVAVAAGFAPLALGSDTGGSIRQPAALCGVVGMKPTYGRVSRYGLVAFASSLDQIGPFAATVADAALLYEVIAGPDDRDSTSIPEPLAPVTPTLDQGVEGLRVGVVNELLGIEGIAPDVAARAHAAAEALEGAGAKVEEVSVPAVDLRAVRLLPDRAGRGVEQPGPLRRRPLRAPGRRAHHRRDVRPHPHGRLRRRGQAPHHARHLRPVGRLLRRLLRQGPEGPHAHHPRLRRRLRALRRAALAHVAHHRVRARGQGAIRWPCTSTTSARSRRTWPATRRSRCPSAPATTACPSACRCMAPRPRRGRPCSASPPPSKEPEP